MAQSAKLAAYVLLPMLLTSQAAVGQTPSPQTSSPQTPLAQSSSIKSCPSGHCAPTDVPEPESGVVFAMGISTFLLSQWLRRRFKK